MDSDTELTKISSELATFGGGGGRSLLPMIAQYAAPSITECIDRVLCADSVEMVRWLLKWKIVSKEDLITGYEASEYWKWRTGQGLEAEEVATDPGVIIDREIQIWQHYYAGGKRKTNNNSNMFAKIMACAFIQGGLETLAERVRDGTMSLGPLDGTGKILGFVFHAAIATENIPLLQLLRSECEFDLTKYPDHGSLALIIAICEGKSKSIKELREGFKLDSINPMTGNWCLNRACSVGSIALVDELSHFGSKFINASEDRHPALESACIGRHVDVVRLLRTKFNVTARQAKSAAGLGIISGRNGHTSVPILKELRIGFGLAAKDITGKILRRARAAPLQEFIDGYGVPISQLRAQLFDILKRASKRNDVELLLALKYVHGVTQQDIRARQNEALRYAAMYGSVLFIRGLKEHFGLVVKDVQSCNWQVLREAIQYGRWEVLRELRISYGITSQHIAECGIDFQALFERVSPHSARIVLNVLQELRLGFGFTSCDIQWEASFIPKIRNFRDLCIEIRDGYGCDVPIPEETSSLSPSALLAHALWKAVNASSKELRKGFDMCIAMQRVIDLKLQRLESML
jgi:hypothetical protein